MSFEQENKCEYASGKMVSYYAAETNLQPAEEWILRRLLREFERFRMLDIGVGGGRTTLHFGPWTSEYVGADYVEEMIRACRDRFAGYPRAYRFQACDARNMTMFNSHSFDFVLFSFNGIDHVSQSDRTRIIDEMHRVCAPGGFVAFSSHNLNRTDGLLNMQWDSNPLMLLRRMRQWLRLNFVHNNPADLRKNASTEYLILNNGVHDYALRTYYAEPLFQKAMLLERFRSVEILDLEHGLPLSTDEEIRSCRDAWLYYLCRS